jgi:hypothetical protein
MKVSIIIYNDKQISYSCNSINPIASLNDILTNVWNCSKEGTLILIRENEIVVLNPFKCFADYNIQDYDIRKEDHQKSVTIEGPFFSNILSQLTVLISSSSSKSLRDIVMEKLLN